LARPIRGRSEQVKRRAGERRRTRDETTKQKLDPRLRFLKELESRTYPLLIRNRIKTLGVFASLRRYAPKGLRYGEEIMSAKITITIPDWLDKICAWPLMIYRKRKYGGAFRRIDIGEGKYTLVEPEDYYTYGKYKWVVYGTGSNLYVIRHRMTGEAKTETVYMHREIMNPPKGLLVDHRYGVSLDNRRGNLRLATPSENMLNRKKKKNTTSRYRGVWRLKNGKYESQITDHGKRIHLGWFDSEIEAAKAYDVAAKKCHKEFARLNFPEDSLKS